MILTILHLLLVSMLIWVPLFFYGHRSRRMVKFCQRMTRLNSCRKAFCYALVSILLILHATCPELCQEGASPYVSTILVIWLASPKRMMGLLRDIRSSQPIMAILAINAVAMFFTTGMYTLGLTFSFLLMAAMFYPSKAMKAFVAEEKAYSNYQEYEEETVKHYFSDATR